MNGYYASPFIGRESCIKNACIVLIKAEGYQQKHNYGALVVEEMLEG